MKNFLAAVTIMAACGALAAVTTVTTPDNVPATLSAGRINYTGPSGTCSKNITLSGNKQQAVTFDVQNEATRLTLSGAMSPAAPNVTFIKYGPGTLLWTGKMDITFVNAGVGQYNGTRLLDWDANGMARTDGNYGFANFEVAQGTFVFNSPGSKLNGYNAYIGSDRATLDTIPRLEVLGGTFVGQNIIAPCYSMNMANNAFNGQPVKIYIAKGAEVSAQVIWAGFGATAPYSFFDVAGGTYSCDLKGLQMNSYGALTFDVHNGGLLNFHNELAAQRTGSNYNNVEASFSLVGNSNVTFRIREGSTFKSYATSVKSGGHLFVSGNSKVFLDRGQEATVRDHATGGEVEFDGASIEPLTPGLFADWFTTAATLKIGPGGLTASCDNAAVMDGVISGSGTITKKGAGVLAIQPSAADINIQEGAVAFTVSPGSGANPTGTITAAPGTKIIAAGPNTLGRMKITASGQTAEFRGAGDNYAALFTKYQFNHSALPMRDGWMRLNEPRVTGPDIVTTGQPKSTVHTNQFGSVWMATKMDVSKDFTIDFDYAVTRTFPEIEDGEMPHNFSFGWQNEGPTVVGFGCYDKQGGWDSKWSNSFAFGFDPNEKTMHHTVNGSFVDSSDNYRNSGSALFGCGTFMEPAHVRIAYVASTKKFTMTMSRNGESSTLQSTQDLQDALKGAEAYFGFAGGGAFVPESRSAGANYVANVKITYGEPTVETVAIGGEVTIPNGQRLDVKLDSGVKNGAWQVNSLAFDGDVTLNVDGGEDSTFLYGSFVGNGTLYKGGAAALGLPNSANPMVGDVVVNDGSLSIGFSSYDPRFEPTFEKWWTNPARTNEQGQVMNTPASGGAVTLAGGFKVGREQNKEKNYVDNLNTREQIDINCPWTISYKLVNSCSSVKFNQGSFSFYLHNDPRGYEAASMPMDTSTPFDGATRGFVNCIAFVGYTYATVDNPTPKEPNNSRAHLPHTSEVFLAVNGVEQSGTRFSTLPVDLCSGATETRWREDANQYVLNDGNYQTAESDVRISYSPAEQKLTLRIEQQGNVFEQSYDVDLTAALGDTKAYVGFGTRTPGSWFNTQQTITNFKYDDGKSASGSCVKGTVTFTCDTGSIRMNGAEEGTIYKLCDILVVPNEFTLKPISVGNEAVLTVGRIEGTGIFTIDGGILAIDKETLGMNARVRLVGGARLQVADGESVIFDRLTVDGKRVEAGTWNAQNCDFITGGGSVRISDQGFLIQIR